MPVHTLHLYIRWAGHLNLFIPIPPSKSLPSFLELLDPISPSYAWLFFANHSRRAFGWTHAQIPRMMRVRGTAMAQNSQKVDDNTNLSGIFSLCPESEVGEGGEKAKNWEPKIVATVVRGRKTRVANAMVCMDEDSERMAFADDSVVRWKDRLMIFCMRCVREFVRRSVELKSVIR